jgi:hypothetical protein
MNPAHLESLSKLVLLVIVGTFHIPYDSLLSFDT